MKNRVLGTMMALAAWASTAGGLTIAQIKSGEPAIPVKTRGVSSRAIHAQAFNSYVTGWRNFCGKGDRAMTVPQAMRRARKRRNQLRAKGRHRRAVR